MYGPNTRSSVKGRVKLVELCSSSDDETTKKRAPRKKVKKTTEERIKEIAGSESQNANEDEMVDDQVETGDDGTDNIKTLSDARKKLIVPIHVLIVTLINALPLEFIQMNNNKGYHPLARLIKRLEVRDISCDFLDTIDAFGKSYTKFGLSINDIKFEKNQNLLHKLINLNYEKGIVTILISHGVDANSVDEEDNIPLFYFLRGKFEYKSDFDLLMHSISEETLSRHYKNKNLLANIIEMFIPRFLGDNYYLFDVHIPFILQLIEHLLSSGCKLDEALNELSVDMYEKGNTDLNKSIFMILLILVMGEYREEVEKILHHFVNVEKILIKPLTFQNFTISPLMILLYKWGKENAKQAYYETFHSTEPLFSPKVLDNIIDIPNLKIDAIVFAIAILDKRLAWRYFENIIGIDYVYKKAEHQEELVRYFEKYRYYEEGFGSINIIQIVKLMSAHINQMIDAFNGFNEILALLTNEPFQNSDELILEQIAKTRCLNIGKEFINHFDRPIPLEWTCKYSRLAFEHNNFQTCCEILQEDNYKHDFTNEEKMQIIIESNSYNQVQLLQKHFNGLSLKERFQLFSTRFKVHFSTIYTKGLGYYLQDITKRLRFLPLLSRDLEREKYISLLDICLIEGLMAPYIYIFLDITITRKRRKLL